MADDTNPFTMMGMMQMMQPNKYTDPAFRNKPLGLQGYLGTPTDALGNPIQSFTDAQAKHDAWKPTPGTTLNSNPGANLGGDTIRGGMLPASSPEMDANFQGAANSAYLAGGAAGNNALYAMGYGQGGNVRPGSQASIYGGAQDPAMQARMNPGPSAYYSQGASNSLGGNQYDSARIPMTPFAQSSGATSGQPAAAAAAPAATNPVDMRQAYLTALSNPGKVTTPGANVPQAAPLGEPSVLNSFLAAHPGGGTAAPAGGGYGNAGFFDTLNKLRSA